MGCRCFALSACGSSAENTGSDSPVSTQAENREEKSSTSETPNSTSATETDPVSDNTEAEQSSKESSEIGADVLVVYFSATGTTKGVAEKIAAIENADLYEIIAAQPYTDDDLNWHDNNSRTTKEQNDSSVRPEIGSEAIDLSGYSKIYIGYPIWWGEEPRIMDTFVENYDFGDTTMIPFCTSSSSGIGRSGKNLADNAGSGNWLDGARFGGSVSDDELKSWIEGLN